VRDHLGANAEITARNSSASNPASTRTVAAPTWIATAAGGALLAGTNLTNLGALDPRAFCTHRYPIEVFKPSRAAASRTEIPDRTCSRNCCCCSAVYRLRIACFCQAAIAGGYMGSTQRLQRFSMSERD